MSIRERMETILQHLDEMVAPRPTARAAPVRPKRTTFQQFVRSRAEQEAATQTGRRKAPTAVRTKIERGLKRSALIRRQYRLQR